MADKKRIAAFIYSKQFENYEYPAYIPFVVKRSEKTYKLISTLGLLNADNIKTIAAKKASRTELEKFHSPGYLDILHLAAEEKICIINQCIDYRTSMCTLSLDA